ncbi:hypothetical protein BY996DRAFT_4560169, partial [Phakopsora pachyrhizi]
INYHHLNNKKNCYGVTGEDNRKLEEEMKMAAPELFDKHPNLMFQLITLFSP